MTDTVMIAGNTEESTGYRFSWGLAIAGGVAATAVTFFLLTLGSGFGLLLVDPSTHSESSMPSFLAGGAIYFFAAQAFGFAVGGHVAGRLLGPLVESRIQEEFRAMIHGLIAWAVTVLATLTVLALAGLTAASTGATTAALYGATATSKTNEAAPTAYLIDVLFRPGTSPVPETAQGMEPTSPSFASNSASDANKRGEAGRILEAGLAHGEQVGAEDRNRLIALVSDQAGISQADASERIDHMQTDIQTKTKHAAEIARKTASYVSLWVAGSLLFGAIIAMFAAVLARTEDDREIVSAR